MNQSHKRLLEQAGDRLASLEEKGRSIKQDLQCILQEFDEQSASKTRKRLLETNIEQLGRLIETTRTARKDMECVLQEASSSKKPKAVDRLTIGHKTMACKLWLTGVCSRSIDDCPFAHGPDDLILNKQTICSRWRNGRCFKDSRLCGYSHEQDEYIESVKTAEPVKPVSQVDRDAADRLLRGLIAS